ncbi:PaaX family transcriptional regulator C-terminal domain-containing protein, partial [Nonomuraea lactucae]|uniref:PaaX family transcriptional regulator C-terminal domain-containing protein n=1 Tax=Nonomuraea lactucae TaxID=2249762 RepID=UPI0023DCF4ED
DRAALRHAMSALRMAELREGTWLRPANLSRAWPETVTAQCTLIDGRPHDDPTPLLWDLDGWAAEAGALARRLDQACHRVGGLAEGFLVSAAVLRHLLADPLLPEELLPGDWPGTALRARYDDFDRRYRELLHRHLTG